MGWKIRQDKTDLALSSFGYKKDDLPEGGKIIEV